MNFLTPDKKLLLKATFLQGTESLLAWQKWQEKVDIENIDHDSYYLLSFLYKNLSHQNIKDSEMFALKGIYKRAWYYNQICWKNLLPILQTLQNSNIKIMVLGDVPLAMIYERYNGCKAIYNYQFLVYSQDMQKALDSLQKLKLGWSFSTKKSENNDSMLLAIEGSNKDCPSLYIHSHLFWTINQNDTDNQLWQSAISKKIGNFSLYVLSPTDQLLFTCLLIFYQNAQLSVVNLTDALLIINNQVQEIDWIRLVNQAEIYKVVLQLENILTVLEAVLEISIPTWVLPSLRKMEIFDR